MQRRSAQTLSLEDWRAWLVAQGQPAFRAKQLIRQLHVRGATSFEEMSDLPAALRAKLREAFDIERLTEVTTQRAQDGTQKTLFKLPSGRHIETVLIPGFDDTGTAQRITICVSSQVGCAMGCTFCATGRMGFHENLAAWMIHEQVRFMDRRAHEVFGRGVTNVVFMGMGEPLLNYEQVKASIGYLQHPDGLHLGRKRITVSTVGLARRIRKLADERLPARLAVSLHASLPQKRSDIMPVNRTEDSDLPHLVAALRYYVETTGEQVTYEYCLFDQFNDGKEDAQALAGIVRKAPGKVNIILYNPVEGVAQARIREERLNAFVSYLVALDVRVTVRRSRGLDIDAACGQLADRIGS